MPGMAASGSLAPRGHPTVLARKEGNGHPRRPFAMLTCPPGDTWNPRTPPVPDLPRPLFPPPGAYGL